MVHQIYIAEDHAFMREAIRVCIQREPDLNVCGLAASSEDAARDLVDTQADVILIDMSLPKMSGTDLILMLLARQPGLRCLIYSGHGEVTYVERALKAGAWGYVLKGSPDELLKAIRQVIGGEAYLSEVLRKGSIWGRS